MDLKSTLQRKKPAEAITADDPVQIARRRARYRLLGAAVLLALGIVGFPWLFETRPRPVSMDTPIVTTAKINAEAPMRLPRPASAPEIDPNANLEAESPAPVEAPASAAAAAAAAVTPPAAPQASAAGPAVAVSALPSVPASGQPAGTPLAKAAAAGAAAAALPAAAAKAAVPPAAAAAATPPSRPPAAETGRFVVQVGAFADAAATRETRQKVERLGLKTYTQVVDTEAGKRTRVRVGPFPTREAADQALAKLKSAKLPGTVLTL